jgi:A/G-specific adenine glycosylase
VKLDQKKVGLFQKRVIAYYLEEGRELPWRQTQDPYAILLSEVMCQQTQVDRVIPFYTAWLEKWPTPDALSKADTRSVLAAWQGLGYNNRALRLQHCAKLIVEEYGGNVLAAMKDYLRVPGIGPYTSSAVRIFSANEDIVTVDTNIRRIFIHEFELDEKISDKELWDLAGQCVPKGKSRDWHNALMDYGATQLTSRKTGIRPKTKQSKFEGSDRQIRGRVLRHFLADGQMVTIDKIGLAVSETDMTRLKTILLGMVKDKLLVFNGRSYRLTE